RGPVRREHLGLLRALGSFRYLLFDLARTEEADPFGNTFYSEIDVIDRAGPAPVPVAGDPAGSPGAREIVLTEGGQHQIVIDTTGAPDLTEWARRELAPIVREWYPKIAAMLPSDGYAAPARVSIYFQSDMNGVASTSGTRIRCAASWFRRNLEGEAKGAVVHELVHVVQDYGRARRAGSASMAPPGWLVEGIADYIRWFLYEPQSKGAEITARNLSRARYDGNYRISANFLNWLAEKHRPEIVRELNAALREGRYRDDLWQALTGRTVSELGAAWREDLERRIQAEPK
ncbi:MAG TPA: basic secretory protein-like protein, partial [Candidatus Paceibacterota bacterium]|nr:basic secretory protein-like protein [Candidatus Paceibacterota bacterium]